MEQTLKWNNFYSHPRFWRHMIPWLFVLLFLYISIFVVGIENDDVPIENVHSVFIVLAELLALIYGSFYAYNTIYKEGQRKRLFFAILILLIVGISLCDHFFSTQVVQLGAIKGFWANLVLFPVVVLVAFGLKLSYHGTKQLFVIERLRAKQAESELKLLKSQVNPHFLFNTLNNIYSTNLEDHDKANEIILELSDLLRYQLESNKSTYTSLAQEINSIENYIDLEKIRVLDCSVTVQKEGDFSEAKIVPLLLLPFVENAFKYGTGIEPGQIDIDMKLTNKRVFHFHIRNKIIQKKGKVHSGGIGLENVKKRLSIMYQDRHELEIKNEHSHFTVQLKIEL